MLDFPENGAPTTKMGAPIYYFLVNLFQTLHGYCSGMCYVKVAETSYGYRQLRWGNHIVSEVNSSVYTDFWE